MDCQLRNTSRNTSPVVSSIISDIKLFDEILEGMIRTPRIPDIYNLELKRPTKNNPSRSRTYKAIARIFSPVFEKELKHVSTFYDNTTEGSENPLNILSEEDAEHREQEALGDVWSTIDDLSKKLFGWTLVEKFHPLFQYRYFWIENTLDTEESESTEVDTAIDIASNVEDGGECIATEMSTGLEDVEATEAETKEEDSDMEEMTTVYKNQHHRSQKPRHRQFRDAMSASTNEASDLPLPPPISPIAVSRRTMEIFGIVFPISGQSDHSHLDWTEVRQAMADVGFASECVGGSKWKFQPTTKLKEEHDVHGITIHGPHRDSRESTRLLPYQIRDLGAMLRVTFGWGLETFVSR